MQCHSIFVQVKKPSEKGVCFGCLDNCTLVGMAAWMVQWTPQHYWRYKHVNETHYDWQSIVRERCKHALLFPVTATKYCLPWEEKFVKKGVGWGGWKGKAFLSTGEQMHLKSKWIIEMDKMFRLEGICHCLGWKQGCSKELVGPPFTFSVNAQSFNNHIQTIVVNLWTTREVFFSWIM